MKIEHLPACRDFRWIQIAKETVRLAETLFGYRDGMPAILEKRMGGAAGKAFLTRNAIILNPDYYGEPDYSKTVVHEIAHLVAFRLYGDRGHGHAWKRVARNLGDDGERCHTYEVKRVRETRKFIATCSCKTHQVGPTIMRRIQTGERNYICKSCRTPVKISVFQG
jgi:SprT protein